eukprot:4206727-Alexandrium_andersonii.AAC.1
MPEVPIELVGLVLGHRALVGAAVVGPLKLRDGPHLRDGFERVVTGAEHLIRLREAGHYVQRVLLVVLLPPLGVADPAA